MTTLFGLWSSHSKSTHQTYEVRNTNQEECLPQVSDLFDETTKERRWAVLLYIGDVSNQLAPFQKLRHGGISPCGVGYRICRYESHRFVCAQEVQLPGMGMDSL